MAWVSQDIHRLSPIISCIPAVEAGSATEVLLLCLTMIHMHSLFNILCLKAPYHQMWAITCYLGQIVEGIYTEHILFTEEHICHYFIPLPDHYPGQLLQLQIWGWHVEHCSILYS